VRGGKRPGAGRKKGSIKLLPEQALDLFYLIGVECQRIENAELHRNLNWVLSKPRLVRRVCNQIAKDLDLRWVDLKTGRLVATCNCWGPALANIYYAILRQRRPPKPWLLEDLELDRSELFSTPIFWALDTKRRTTRLSITERRAQKIIT